MPRDERRLHAKSHQCQLKPAKDARVNKHEPLRKHQMQLVAKLVKTYAPPQLPIKIHKSDVK